MGKFFTVNPIIDEFDKRTLHLERSSPPAIVRVAADSPVEESGFEPSVPFGEKRSFRNAITRELHRAAYQGGPQTISARTSVRQPAIRS
jgi:hypothetical protein